MSMSSARLPTQGLHYRNARLTTEHPHVVKIGRASRFVKGSMYLIAGVIAHAVGRVAVGVVGAMVVGLGVYRFYKGVTMDAREELDVYGMSPARVVWTERLGLIGEIGRGIGIGLVGFFMLRSAIIYRAAQVAGLDAALRRLAVESWGSSLVVVFGIGFAAYGVFCMATFTHRRLQAP